MRFRVELVALAVVLAGCAQEAAPVEDEFALDEDLQATDSTGVIRGVVVDTTITPLAEATVTIQNTGATAVTDAQGLFGFADLEPGSYFLEVSKSGFGAVQQSVEVVAGVDKPPIVRVLLEADPSTAPFVEPLHFKGRLTCGAAVFYTSVGCTTFGFIADAVGDTSIWSLDFETLPQWTQGELVWRSTQTLSGNFIWQIVQSEYPGSPQPHIGYMETTGSPSLTYLDNGTIDEYADWILDKGIDYRFFGGPHDLCPQHVGDPGVNRFGCGVTLEQDTDAYIHHFYNFMPDDGWRFTSDGDHPLP